MAAGSALKKINARVKHLARLHPGKKRVTLQKQAGAEYRAGKLGGVKKKSRKKIVRRVKALHRAEGRAIKKLSGTLSAGASSGVMGVRSTFQAAAIGALSPSSHMAHARRKIEDQIGQAEARKFVAKKKSTKRKIAKHIAKLKTQFRKLC